MLKNTMSVFAFVAMLAYVCSLSLIIPTLLGKNKAYRRIALLCVLLAIACHAITLYQRIFDVSTGQNLSVVNIGSIISLIICSIMTFVASHNRGWFLLPIVYCFALINLAFTTFVPGEFITHLETNTGLMIHIGLALFSYSTLMIAALYALQLAWLDYQLKNKKLIFTRDMPPLMTIERKLFHITQAGVILLSLALITGFLFLDRIYEKENLNKALLSMVAWAVYIVLLWGHYRGGWRGRRVVWFSLVGALLLTISYFGSRLLQQII
jgi:ABC-type uncharacterized transport system permease subunit